MPKSDRSRGFIDKYYDRPVKARDIINPEYNAGQDSVSTVTSTTSFDGGEGTDIIFLLISFFLRPTLHVFVTLFTSIFAIYTISSKQFPLPSYQIITASVSTIIAVGIIILAFRWYAIRYVLFFIVIMGYLGWLHYGIFKGNIAEIVQFWDNYMTDLSLNTIQYIKSIIQTFAQKSG